MYEFPYEHGQGKMQTGRVFSSFCLACNSLLSVFNQRIAQEEWVYWMIMTSLHCTWTLETNKDMSQLCRSLRGSECRTSDILPGIGSTSNWSCFSDIFKQSSKIHLYTRCFLFITDALFLLIMVNIGFQMCFILSI